MSDQTTTPEPDRDAGLVVSGLSDDAFFALREKLSRAADDHLTHLFGDRDRGDVAEEAINAVLGALTMTDIAALPREPSLEEVLAMGGMHWFKTAPLHTGGWRAWVYGSGAREGKADGPTIAEAVRNAVAAAGEGE